MLGKIRVLLSEEAARQLDAIRVAEAAVATHKGRLEPAGAKSRVATVEGLILKGLAPALDSVTELAENAGRAAAFKMQENPPPVPDVDVGTPEWDAFQKTMMERNAAATAAYEAAKQATLDALLGDIESLRAALPDGGGDEAGEG